MSRLSLPGCLAALAALGAFTSAADPPRQSTLREFVRVVDRPWQRIGLTVTVTDRQGLPARGLPREAFRVFENGLPVDLADFGVEGTRLDRPLSVAVLLDMSQSMAGQVKKVREAAEALLRGLRPRDEIMVAKFNDEITVLQPFTADPGDPERTLAKIGRAWGGTALFRSVAESLRDLRERPGRKVILVVSDGLDNDVGRGPNALESLYVQDLLRLCLRSQTIVYGIRPGMSATSWLPFEGFVEATGGRLLYTGGDLERLFTRLAEEFLSQYYLGYDVDPKVRRSRWHGIRVEVLRPGLFVRSMGGYVQPRAHLQALLAALSDRDAPTRGDAAYELGFSGDARAARALFATLDDPQEGVRRLAVEALARLGDPAAIPRLAGRVWDGSASVREAAGSALMLFGAAAIPDLAAGIGNPARVGAGPADGGDDPGLFVAMRVLAWVGDDRAVEPLASILRSGAPGTRRAAAESLGDLGLGTGIPALRAALADPAPEVRRAALRSIATIAGAPARPLIEDYLRREADPDLRRAARALMETL